MIIHTFYWINQHIKLINKRFCTLNLLLDTHDIILRLHTEFYQYLITTIGYLHLMPYTHCYTLFSSIHVVMYTLHLFIYYIIDCESEKLFSHYYLFRIPLMIKGTFILSTDVIYLSILLKYIYNWIVHIFHIYWSICHIV